MSRLECMFVAITMSIAAYASLGFIASFATRPTSREVGIHETQSHAPREDSSGMASATESGS
jgi:hypothetical protein